MIFRLVQENLSILGISKSQSTRSFYGKLFIGHLVLGTGVITHILFLLRDDISFEEYMESINVTAIAVACLLSYMILMFKMQELFAFIESCERVLDMLSRSQCRFAFSSSNFQSVFISRILNKFLS